MVVKSVCEFGFDLWGGKGVNLILLRVLLLIGGVGCYRDFVWDVMLRFNSIGVYT